MLSPLREREKEIKGERKRKRERERESERERERRREREFFKGLTGAFAHFSFLVLYSYLYRKNWPQ